MMQKMRYIMTFIILIRHRIGLQSWIDLSTDDMKKTRPQRPAKKTSLAKANAQAGLPIRCYLYF